MNPAVTYPDPELRTMDLLDDLLAVDGEVIETGIQLAPDWTVTDGPHIQLALLGDPVVIKYAAVRSTIKFTVRAASKTEAKRIAFKAYGLLLSHPGDDTVHSIQDGIAPTPDPATRDRVEIVWFTLLCQFRSEPIGS